MGRTICALLLLVLAPHTFGASILRQLNDEVRKINELVDNLHDVCNSPSVRALRRTSSMERTEAALTDAAKLQQKPQSIFYKSSYEPDGDPGEKEDKSSMGEVAPRSLNSTTEQVTHSGRKNSASDLEQAKKVRDEAQARVDKLKEAKEIEDKIKAEIAKEMKLKEEKAREEKLKAKKAKEEKLKEEKAREEKLKEEKAKEEKLKEEKLKAEKLKEAATKADATTMEPPKFIGPTLTGQQLFNNLFYEALGNTMRQIISKNPELKENLGEDWDPVTLMRPKHSSHPKTA